MRDGTGLCEADELMFIGLTSFTAPYFINKENLNWGAKYAYIWAGSNLATFSECTAIELESFLLAEY